MEKCITEGDQNTNFFHNIATGRQRNNIIRELTVGVTVLSLDKEISSGISSFFKSHFTKGTYPCCDCD